MITEPPGAEEVLKELSALIPIIDAALEAGSQEAKEFFEFRNRPVDACLAPDILRWRAKHYLDEAGHAAEFEREGLSNNGLSVVYKTYNIRIRKAVNGTAPVPGPSKILQGFYGQAQLSFQFPDDEPKQEVDLLNLLFLWSSTADYSLRGDMILACPKSGALTRESVQLHWEVPVPHPALSIESIQQTDLPDDLDHITLDEPEEETGTDSAQ